LYNAEMSLAKKPNSGIAAAIALSGMLTACATPLERYQRGEDTCGRSFVEPFVGQAFDDLDIDSVLPDRYHFRSIDPRDPDRVYISNLVFRRLNIELDGDGTVIGLKCG
jgi:hypothetical protein